MRKDEFKHAYGDSVIEFLIELFSVLNKTTDCVSCPCQAHACAVTTRANIDTSYGTDSLKGGFVAKQIAKPMVNPDNNSLNVKVFHQQGGTVN